MARVEGDNTVEHDKGYESLARLMRDYPKTTMLRQFKALCAEMLMFVRLTSSRPKKSLD